jgi:hypothetical protein
MLKKYFGIDVPVGRLEQTGTLGDVLKVVIPFLPALGSTHEERVVQKKITRVVMASYTQTKHEVIFNLACVKCGLRLGAEGLRLGKERRLRWIRDFRTETPGQLISAFWDIDAVCPRCGCEYAYDSVECSLKARKTRTGAEPGAPPNGGHALLPGDSGLPPVR